MKIQMFDKDGNPLGEFEGEIWFEAENPLTVEHALNFTWPVDKSENMTVAATWEAEVTFEIEDPLRLGLSLGIEPMDTAEAVEDWLRKQRKRSGGEDAIQ